jgi:hypothetical protein
MGHSELARAIFPALDAGPKTNCGCKLPLFICAFIEYPA